MKRTLSLLFAVRPGPPPDPVAAASRRSTVRALLREAQDKAQFFELYKLLVSSSEALVARRQAVNTYFITVNGLLATGTGLLLQRDTGPYLTAISLAVLSIVGIITSVVWRLILISFGQLNRGKFVVIAEMEKKLAAEIYAAEWEALGKGEDPTLYRSFTEREALVPAAFLALWGLVALVFALLALLA